MVAFYYSVYMAIHVSKAGVYFPLRGMSSLVFVLGAFVLANPFALSL
jgi:hypothetical protein